MKKRKTSPGLFGSKMLEPFTLRLGFGLGSVDLGDSSVGNSGVGDGVSGVFFAPA